MLTLLTDRDGKISARARGALRKGSKTAAATQQLTYSELTLFGNRGRWTVNEAAVIEPFSGLREDIGRLALGAYVAECLEALSVEDQADPALLSLGLNSLFALSQGSYSQKHIKAAFELRLMCLGGYEPQLSFCALCGEEPEEPCLGLSDGRVFCRRCRAGAQGMTEPLSPGTMEAMRYIVSAPAKRFLSFRLEGRELDQLAAVCEKYLLINTERGFSTLDYWKKVKE